MKENDAVYISQLKAQLEEYREDYKKQKGKADNRYKYMSMIAEKICSSDYGEKQLGGKNKILALEDTELRDFIINDYNKQRGEYIQTIKKLQEFCLSQKEESLDLAKQVLQLQEEKKNLENTIKLAKKKIQQKELMTPSSKDGEETPQFGDIQEEVPQFGDIFEEAEKTVNDQNIFIFKNQPVNIKETAQKLNEIQKDVLYAVGHEGISETELIKEWMQKEKNVSESKTTKVLSMMVKDAESPEDFLPLLIKERANTVFAPNRYMYKLNTLGKKIYSHIYKKNPVKCEMELLTQQHASLPHGICIRDTAIFLANEAGFKNVRYFDEDNTFDVGGTEKYIPDITAENDRGELTFWEVELAHHNDADFSNKLEKAIKVTNTLYIIANDTSAQRKLLRQVDRYISKKKKERNPNQLGAGKRKPIYFYVYTMNQLKNKKIFQEDKKTSTYIKTLK